MISKSILPAALAAITITDADAQLQTADRPIEVVGSRISAPADALHSPDPIGDTVPATTLELLQDLPDVRAVTTGGTGGTSFLSIRGAEPNFAQILIDGVRVSNPSSSQGGGFDFAQLDPALVERITIIPASRSAVHGADALSGVVAIDLLSPASDRSSGGLTAAADSEDGYALSGRLGVALGDNGGLLFSAGTADTGALSEGSTLERDQALARASRDIGDWSLSAFLLYGETARSGFPESSGGSRFSLNRALETRNTRFTTTGIALAGDDAMAVRPSLRLGYYDDTVSVDTPAIYPGVFDPVPALVSDTDFSRLEVTGDVRIRLSDSADLVVGASHQREDATSIGTIDFGFPVPTAFDIERDQSSLFSEAEWRAGDGLTLSLAARHDRFDDDYETTLQASGEYAIAGTGVTAFAGYAEGFRQPSLFALAYPLTANPDLRPERSTSWTAGLLWQTGATHLRASAFRNTYTDLIDFDPAAFRMVNRSETRIQGISLSAQGEIGAGVTWASALTLLDYESEAPLRGRPDWHGNARLVWDATPTMRIGASARFNSDLLETSVPTGVVELDGHTELDLFADWQASDRLALSLVLRNAMDADYQDAVGFPAPGRVVRLRTGITF